MIRSGYIAIITCCLFCAGINKTFAQKTDVQQLNDAVRNITNVIMHDVYSPPAASRIYAYSTIAAYEVMQQASDSFPSYYGRINKMPYLQENSSEINLTLTGLLSLYYTAQSFLFSYKELNPYIDSLINEYRAFLSEKDILNAQLWAGTMAMKMMGWAGEDGFKKIHNMPRYELLNAPYAWQPTPPDFADPVEPYWGLLRPFVLDSGDQVVPLPCTLFSTDTSSDFYVNAQLVYDAGKH